MTEPVAQGAVEAFIGLGSNLGDRETHILSAVAALEGVGRLVASSSLYETAPVGDVAQGDYLNAVAVVQTGLDARTVLDGLLAIERAHGRERRERWGPRTLDLDLLMYGDAVISEPGLVVPHPRLAERRFVLEPMLEIRPDATLPDGTPLAGLLAATLGQQIRRQAGPS